MLPLGFPGFPKPLWISHPRQCYLRSLVFDLKSPHIVQGFVIRVQPPREVPPIVDINTPRKLSAMSCDGLQDALNSDQTGPHVHMAQILLSVLLL